MAIVASKYRGTPNYFRALAELVRAAEYRGVTTYQDIAVIMGLPLQGSYMGKEIGHVLGEICEDEVDAGRPMLSAVAVGVSGKPGPGFYALAKEFGKFSGASSEEEGFWRQELQAAYETWRRPLHKPSQPGAQAGSDREPLTVEERPRVRVGSPRLARPEQAADFTMEVSEESQDASLR